MTQDPPSRVERPPVLILTDDWIGLRELCDNLDQAGIGTRTTFSPEEALLWSGGTLFPLTLLRLDAPDVEVMKIALAIGERLPRTRFLILTNGRSTPDLRQFSETYQVCLMPKRSISNPHVAKLMVRMLETADERL